MNNRCFVFFFFFSSRRRHTRCSRDWSSDVCSSDLLEVPVEADGIRDVPAVEAEALLRLVEPVRPQDQGQARVGSGELLVLLGLLVLEVVRAAEIVLGTGAADGGELR